MSVLTRQQLEASLNAGRLSSLYLLIGEESFLRDSAASAIADAALSETLLRDFNEHTFDLLTQSVQDAVAAAEQLPMMSPRRVVKIRNFAKLAENDELVLSQYLTRPNESTVMVFVAAEVDRRKLISKALLDNCVVVDFPAVKKGEALQWVRRRLEQMKLTAEEQALQELFDMVGPDIRALNSEVEKLASSAAKTGYITREMVEELTGRSREISNFDLGDYIILGQRKRALETLHRLLQNGVYPPLLIGSISSTYHKLALGKEIISRGTKEDVMRQIPMSQWKRNDFLTAVQRHDPERIARGIELIAAADLAIKTSQGTPRLQLEFLVCELASLT